VGRTVTACCASSRDRLEQLERKRERERKLREQQKEQREQKERERRAEERRKEREARREGTREGLSFLYGTFLWATLRVLTGVAQILHT
jgi:hypothetical protein